jgi:membrane protein required for colicin V production
VNGFDVALLVFAVILLLIGMSKGLLRILIGMLALVAAFVFAARFHEPLAQQIGGLDLPDGALRLIAYVSVFLLVLLCGGLASFYGRRMIRAAMLGWLDRAAGGALGLLTAALVAALIFMPLVSYAPGSLGTLDGSLLAPFVVMVADLVHRVMPAETAQRYRHAVDALRTRWHGPAAETI